MALSKEQAELGLSTNILFTAKELFERNVASAIARYEKEIDRSLAEQQRSVKVLARTKVDVEALNRLALVYRKKGWKVTFCTPFDHAIVGTGLSLENLGDYEVFFA